MAGNQHEDAADRALLAFLAAQRGVVLSIVEGLDEESWHRPVVPSGWTPAGMVEHLGGAEHHWFQQVVADSREDQPLGAKPGHLLQDLRQRPVLGEQLIDVVVDTVGRRYSDRHGRGSFLH